MQLALVVNDIANTIVKMGATVTLPDGSRVSPAVAGWSSGGYRLLPIDRTPLAYNPNSQTIAQNDLVEWIVHEDHVEVTYTVTDIPIEAIRTTQQTRIDEAFNAAAAALTAGYPEAERLTWPTQQAEALAWGADNDTPTPYLDGIAQARGIDPAQMRALTLAQVQAFQAASQALVGTRQKLRDMVAAAQTVDDILAVEWPQEPGG